MKVDSSYVDASYLIALAVLTLAIGIRLRTIIKHWQDPLLRAVGGLLLMAIGVFFFATPSTIALVNRLTGVPNISAPWVYSLLTAYWASCLVLIINWRGGPAEKTRRASLWVWSSYAAVIIALWVLFAFADVSEERLRDLDTYFANTPYMREHIVLYLVAHGVACLVSSALIWNWIRRTEVERWTRGGLGLLGVGYVLNIGYGTAKFTAVIARWTGNNLDWLSTHAGPPIAAASALFIGIGFILPHAGPYLEGRWHTRARYRDLGPLWQLLRSANPTAATVRLPPRPGLDLLLTQRESDISDGLLSLHDYLDRAVRTRAYDEASRQGISPGEAEGFAGALTVLAAIDALKAKTAADEPIGAEGLGDPAFISRALRDSSTVETIRQRAARSESVPVHE